MRAPSGSTIRPVDPAADLPAVSALFLACDLADVGEVDHQEDWIAETWRNPATGAWVAEVDGAAVGYLELESYDTSVAFDAYVPVHPDHRGGPLRAALVAGAEDEARARATAPEVAIRVSGSATDPTLPADLAGAGYAHVRTFWHMERALDPAEDPGDPPPGVVIRSSVDPDDDEAVYGVLEEAFRGHFGITPMTLEEWRVQFKGGMYDPALVLLAEADGEPAGVAASWLPDGLGWVGDLGVLARFRGRGIGTSLLRRSFAVLAARGATQMRLNVDAGNESGAVRLYTSVGMRERRRFLVYEKSLRATG